MSLLDYFKRSKPSASIARERLQILVAHERASITQAAYLPQLKQELLEVIQKYFNVNEESVSVNLEQDDNNEILELNVVFPDEEMNKKQPQTQTHEKKGKHNVRANRAGRR
ncbi:MAG: cell division topological specificity factor MinE [Methylococcales bacterium]|nr:cell division topological specificity factor MinE [Methylococcales bacterium]MCK5925688.1 cell division topological specificity factor MinE [Methylococcales bacterium]